MKTIKNTFFLILWLSLCTSAILAMHNNDGGLWVPKKPLQSEQSMSRQNNHWRHMQNLLSALINQYFDLVNSQYTSEEFSNATQAIYSCEKNAYLKHRDIQQAIRELNQNIQGSGYDALFKAFKNIVKEQKLGSASSRFKHPTDEIIIEWFKKTLHTNDFLLDQSNKFNDYCYSIQNLRLLERDLGIYLFYAALNILAPKGEIVAPKTTSRVTGIKREFSNNNNNINTCQNYPDKKIKIEKNLSNSDRIQKTELLQYQCRFGCNVILKTEQATQTHYISRSHRACPYDNCTERNQEFRHVKDLQSHLNNFHPQEINKFYFCLPCNYVSAMDGLNASRHESTEVHNRNINKE